MSIRMLSSEKRKNKNIRNILEKKNEKSKQILRKQLIRIIRF